MNETDIKSMSLAKMRELQELISAQMEEREIQVRAEVKAEIEQLVRQAGTTVEELFGYAKKQKRRKRASK